MTIPSYPSELPRPLRQGFQLARGDGRESFRTDAGPSLRRRRFSAVVDVVAFSTLLHRDQLARFDRFYVEEAKRGSVPFYMPDPTTHGAPWLADSGTLLLTDEGMPILLGETWLCIFGGRLPAIQEANYDRWNVSFELEVLP